MAKIVGVQSGGVIGSVISHTTPTTPLFALPCDGQPRSRTTYAALFTVIGTSHGSGDGSTTFNVPDYRGMFLRGVDGSAGTDPDKAGRVPMNTGGNPGNQVGSVQGHAFNSHSHGGATAGHVHSAIPNNIRSDLQVGGSSSAYSTGTGSSGSTAATINADGGNESRPVNAYVQYYVVWK